MKKLLVLLLAAAMVVSFAACSETSSTSSDDDSETTADTATGEANPGTPVTPPDANLSVAQTVNAAIEKTNELDSFTVDMKVDMVTKASGMELETPMTIKLTVDKTDPDNIISDNVTSMEFFGMTMEARTYTEGEWSYVVSEGESYKTAAAETDTTKVADTVPDAIFEGKTFTENADGSRSVEIEVAPEDYDKVFTDMTTELASEGGEVKKMILTYTVKDGYLAAYRMYLEMTIEADGEVGETTVDINATYVNPGEKVTITPPEGYQDFDELGSDLDLGDYEFDEDYAYDYELDLSDYEFDEDYTYDFDIDLGDYDFEY